MSTRLLVGLVAVLTSSCTSVADRADRAAPVPPTTVGATSSQTGPAADCSFDQRVIETAIAVYSVTYQHDATNIDELTEFGVADETTRWTLEAPADGSSTAPVARPLPGGPCAD